MFCEENCITKFSKLFLLRLSRVGVSLSVGDADSCLRRKDASRRHDASEWGFVVEKKKTLDEVKKYAKRIPFREN